MSGSTPATAGPSTTSADVSMDGADTFHDYPEPPLPEGLTTNPEDPDDHDEIAHTIPIYISHNLSPALHLFQYPVHHRPPAVTSYAEQRGQHISARMKENVHRFEIEVPVDMRPTVWNEDRAEELGFLPVEEQDAKKKGKKKDEKPENWGSKMRLKSEEVPNVTGYWAGLVHEGALHLHPLDHLLQFRPSLNYLDQLENVSRLEKEREARAKGEGDDDEDDDDNMDEAAAAKSKVKQEADFKTVQMQLAQRPDRTGDIRRGSKMGTSGTVGTTQVIRQNLVRTLQREAEDPWQPWVWEDKQTSSVVNTLSKMLVQPSRRVLLDCKTRPLDLISKKNIGEGASLPN